MQNDIFARSYRLALSTTLGLLICLTFASCARMKLSFADAEERKQMINDRVAKFHKAVYWGNLEEATELVRPERRRTFSMAIAERRKVENLVDFTVDDIQFDREAWSAQVTTSTRYFKSPVYTVVVRKEEERWGYDSSEGGWLLEESRTIEKGKPHISESNAGRSEFTKPF